MLNDYTATQLVKIMMYLKGEIDIYNGSRHQDAVLFWDMIWDEAKHLGCDPETVDGIKKYWGEIDC